MLQRCQNPKATKYYAYGERGISVCDAWQTFAGFVADMGERPKGKTLDRIDGEKGYSPENCRWATPSEQSENLRTVKPFLFDGQATTITALSNRTGISKATLRYRLKNGWSEADTLTVPTTKRSKDQPQLSAVALDQP
jgi:hypothetical protein